MSLRTVGVVARGIRAPIIRTGDDLPQIVSDCVVSSSQSEHFEFHDHDIIGITEAVVARSQGNYASIDQISKDISQKFPNGEFGLIFPILSRNRFSILFKGILKSAKKVTLMLSYPSDEVGNELVSLDLLDEKGVNPYSDVLSESQFRSLFGYPKHPFTGVDYISFYHELANEMNCSLEIIFGNDCRQILKYQQDILCCDIHSRLRSKRLLNNSGARSVFGLDDILKESVDGSGFNEQYGLLGSNKSTETTVKLFPRDTMSFVSSVASKVHSATGKRVEVLIYGDGAFKDPVGKIWELADPVVSPAFTDGLSGTPNELKLKFLADNDLSSLSGEALEKAMKAKIGEKSSMQLETMARMGTTPRAIPDLVGSLCDLTTGSGDKGTPIVLIQGYFDNFSNE